MVARSVVTAVAALAIAGAGMVDIAWAQRGGGGGGASAGGARGGGGGAAIGGGAGMRGGGAPSMAAPSFRGGGGGAPGAAPSFRGGPSGTARSFSGPSRSFSDGNRFPGGNRFAGNSWRGDRRHGRHFRGVVPFVGGFAYTYPYYDDSYYGYDRCAYVDPDSWWWRRYCAPYYGW